MKILSIKRLLGLAAVYGAVQYARKNGGAKNAFNGLLDKAKDFAGNIKNEVSSMADQSTDASSSSTGGIGSRASSSSVGSSSYGSDGFGSSSGFGGNGRRGY